MSKFKIEAEKVDNIEVIVDCTNMLDAVETFKQLHPKYNIDYINDLAVVGFCEITGEPIFENDRYCIDEDGIYILNKNL